jgi:hypothetical protein
MKNCLLFTIAISLGIIVGLIITTLPGKHEACISKWYPGIGYPAICATSFILAFIDPARKWASAILPMLSQLFFLLVINGPGALWPLAFVFNMFWFVGPVIMAHIGQSLRQKD